MILSVARNGPTVKYDGISLKSKKEFLLEEKDLEKIGEVLPELGVEGVRAALNRKRTLPDNDSLEVLNGRARAKWEAQRATGENRERWHILSQAEPGDRLTVQSGWKTKTVVFHLVRERGERYVFLAEDSDGKVSRWALGCLVPSPGP
ncbi:MAG: hypothetical protein HYX68_17765 [Planctomycetes bacterium]|nr:hypothetical protein [Planctomycetota bacterium]